MHYRLRLGILLWLSGMLGVIALMVSLVPQLSGVMTMPGPQWVVYLASIGQSALLVAIAVWLGVLLAPKVGLRAPLFEAAVASRSILFALQPQLLPGLVGGLLGGAGLFAVGGYAAPAALAEVEQQFTIHILARVLYGGITEELLLRWGLMTALVWLTWLFLQRRSGPPKTAVMCLAIGVSALLFGAGHLPAASIQVGELTAGVVLFVVGANAAFGVLFGYLYWRFGLEAAIIAHATAHIIAHATAHIVSYVLSLGVA